MLHIVVHLTLLEFIVKGAGASIERINASATYAETASITPATHFSTNPVHCLRSKYIFGDDPPQSIYTIGKEHLMRANPKIGSYYAPPAAGKPQAKMSIVQEEPE